MVQLYCNKKINLFSFLTETKKNNYKNFTFFILNDGYCNKEHFHISNTISEESHF